MKLAFLLVVIALVIAAYIPWIAPFASQGNERLQPQSVTTSDVDESSIQPLIHQLKSWPEKLELSESEQSKMDAHAEFDTLLSDLIPLFLDAPPEIRTQVRQAAANDRRLQDSIRNYSARAAITLHKQAGDDMYSRFVHRGNVPLSAADGDTLFRLGVGALAIEDCADYRESLTALAELCIRGEQAGILPRRHLDSLAHVFSDKLIGGFGNPERPYRKVVLEFRKSK